MFKPDDDSPELKHVAKNIKSVNECCCVDGSYICNFTINESIFTVCNKQSSIATDVDATLWYLHSVTEGHIALHDFILDRMSP